MAFKSERKNILFFYNQLNEDSKLAFKQRYAKGWIYRDIKLIVNDLHDNIVMDAHKFCEDWVERNDITASMAILNGLFFALTHQEQISFNLEFSVIIKDDALADMEIHRIDEAITFCEEILSKTQSL